MSQLFKNTASQKLRVFAFADAGHATLDPGEPVTGDAANISAVTAVDNGTLGASNDAAPTEVDATNAAGVYEFDPTQAETNGSVIEWYPKSSTAGVQVITVGGNVQTLQPPNFPTLGIESDGDLTKVNTLDGISAVNLALLEDMLDGTGAPIYFKAGIGIPAVRIEGNTASHALVITPAGDNHGIQIVAAGGTGFGITVGDTVNLAGTIIDGDGFLATPVLTRTTIATLASQTSFTLADGPTDNAGVPVGSVVMIKDNGSDSTAVGIVSAYTGSTRTVTLAADPAAYTMGVGDAVMILPPVSVSNSTTGHKAEIQTEAAAALTAIHLDHLLAETYDPASKPGNANALLNFLTQNDSGSARLNANVHQINLSTLAAVRLALSAGQIIPFTVDTVTNTHTPTTTEFQADDITEATADHYNGRLVIWTTGNLAGQVTDVSDYAAVGGIGQFSVTAMTEAPANDDTGILV